MALTLAEALLGTRAVSGILAGSFLAGKIEDPVVDPCKRTALTNPSQIARVAWSPQL